MEEIRQAVVADAPAMAIVEQQSWRHLASGAEQIAQRINTCPTGQWVAVQEGQLVGVTFSQRISRGFFESAPKTFDALTDGGSFARSHHPQGEIYQIISVGVSAAGRGKRWGRRLVDWQIDQAWQAAGVERILGFTRPASYERHPEVPIEEYVHLRSAQGRLVDPVLAFHLNAGARLVSIHPHFRPNDHEARQYGILIEYPRELPRLGGLNTRSES